MTTKPGGLGRGLGELFQRTDGSPITRAMDAFSGPVASAPIGDGSWFQEVPVDQVRPNPSQPRQAFDEEALDELAASVKEVGLLQPIVVRQHGDHYELVMGERRLRAHQRAGLAMIPAIIRATDDEHLLRDALLENLQRVQLNPLEEAAAYQQLIDDFGCTQEHVAAQVHKSRPHVTNTLRLLKLPPAVQRRVAAGVLSAGHARALLGLDDPAAQDRLATRIISEGLSVRATEELVTLGETGRPGTPAKADKPVDPIAHAAATRLEDVLDTRVTVTRGHAKGRIVIEFADDDDLDRILGIIVR
ncbi:MAG: ParB/RepB/Spo0J family partition protein [Actinomycetia bacterium]|nr:ParB/RepB/Spo0J family partition protein [Actinomycetes bacterium]